MKHRLLGKLHWVFLGTALLSGCDQLSERAGFPDPARIEAEGKAIGGTCRHAGRGLEDCYRLNESASKSAVYAGWKEMNEYMIKNNMQAVAPAIPPAALAQPKKKQADAEDENPEDAKTKKKDSHAADGESGQGSPDEAAKGH